MQVDFFILADGAQVAGGKLYILGGGWNIIWVKDFPTKHRMGVAVGIRVGWQQTNERHSFTLEVHAADGGLVQEIAKGEFEAGRPPGIRPGAEQTFMMAINFDLSLERPGDLVVVSAIDGTEMRRTPFAVIHRPDGTPTT